LKSPYLKFLQSKNNTELYTISHVKRFLECFTGDNKFRADVLSSNASLEKIARERGCFIDNLKSLRPVFDENYSGYRQGASLGDWPLTAIWDEYYEAMRSSLPYYTWIGDSNGEFPEFDNWRKRQIARTITDVGTSAQFLVHPPVCYELSEGCSVGCWFCGISAKKFGGHFPLENGGREFWKDVLEATNSVIGRGMATGFCYWATEPLDHPQYDEFIKVYQDIVGVIPQTTTAIPLKNMPLTKKVLALWQSNRFSPVRFSVLTTSIMKRIHSSFSAEELLGVELILQSSESLQAKSIAGKAFSEKGADLAYKKADDMQDGTIACVTGFLVSMPLRKVKLISPTIPSKEWPDGYYVFSERVFNSGKELANAMREMVLAESNRVVKTDTPIQINKNFQFESVDGIQTLKSRHSVVQMEIFSSMGPMLQSGIFTPSQIIKQSVIDGYDPILSIAIMRDLINVGIIGNQLRPKFQRTKIPYNEILRIKERP